MTGSNHTTLYLSTVLVLTTTFIVLATGIILPEKAYVVLLIPIGLAFFAYAWQAPHVVALALVALIGLDSMAILPGGMKEISLFKLLFPWPLFILILGFAIRRFKSPPHHPMDRWILLWTIFYLFLIPLAVDKNEALDFIRRFISMALLYFIVSRLFYDPAKFYQLKKTVILSMVVSAGIGLFTYYTGVNPFSPHQDPNIVRITGASGVDPNTYAVMLYLPLWLAVASGIAARNFPTAAAYYVAGTILAAAVFFTFSRSATLVLGIMALVALIVWHRKLTPIHWGVLLIAIIVGVMLLPPSVWERLTTLGQMFSEKISDPSLSRRSNYLWVGWNIIKAFPFFGAGPGNYAVLHADPAFQTIHALVGVERLPHNLYLQLVTETGPLGLVFLGGITTSAGMTLYRIWKTGGDTAPLAGGLFLTLVGFLLIGLFLHIVLEKVLWLTWAMVRILPEETH